MTRLPGQVPPSNCFEEGADQLPQRMVDISRVRIEGRRAEEEEEVGWYEAARSGRREFKLGSSGNSVGTDLEGVRSDDSESSPPGSYEEEMNTQVSTGRGLQR